MWIFLLVCLAPTSLASRPGSQFVAACGKRLCIDGRPWRMHAAAVYDGLRSPTATVRRARKAHLNTLRIVNFLDEQGDIRRAPFNEARWRRVDRLIARAAKARLRVILDLSTYRNLLLEAHKNPYTTDWKRFIRFVTNRRNTVSEIRYADDPTIALISLAGEVQPPNGEGNIPGATKRQVTRFFRRSFRQWKTADPKHLISTGGLMQLDWKSGVAWRRIFAMRQNDVCSIHAYKLEIPEIPAVASHCARLEKPWITEEFGWERIIGDRDRANRFRRIYRLQNEHGSAGAGFWNLGPSRQQLFNVNGSTPRTLEVVRRAAPRP